jgi:DUF4097 and DUF4098 domain-containing protein YvlB
MLRRLCLVTVILLLVAAPLLLAQPRQSDRDFGRSADTWCDDGWNDRRATHCEVREETLAGGNPLDVDAGPNGGIRVRGWDRGEILVRARIVGYGDTESEARALVGQVRIDTGGGQVRAQGPRSNGDRHWSVSYEVQVPQNSHLTLQTVNGGISVYELRGTVRFRARNGGVSLANVGGDIRGETTNGGLNIELSGTQWDGAGLDVETSNGGVRVDLPGNYSAQLEAGTTNGRVNIDFPVTVQGIIGKHISTTLGSGGPTIRAMTTNGGVTIRRR